MEWNLNKEKTEDGIESEGEFTIFGQTYTRDENPNIHRIGGLIATSSFSVMFLVSILVFGIFITVFAPVIITIIEIVLSGLILFVIAGVLKYIITGNGKPFFELKRGNSEFSISFLEW